MRAAVFAGCFAALVLGGCGMPVEAGIAHERQAIADGELDLDDTGVVLVRRTGTQRSCSGSVIGPNLVLTARHCVSDFTTADAEGILCGRTAFGEVNPAQEFEVALGADFLQPTGSALVREVWAAPNDGGFCDNDVALLVLASALPPDVSRRLEPRVEAELRPNEEYAAVGFGAIRDSGEGFGLRRRRDGLTVDCVGRKCGVPDVGLREWQAGVGLCRGDSGGPALDQNGRVIGVASRAAARCESPIYASVYANRAWLVASALEAARLGEVAPPSWTAPQPVARGCSASPVAGAAALALLGLARRHQRLQFRASR